MTVVYQPDRGHYCGPNEYGYWMAAWDDQPGTVRECEECGKSWVAYKPPQPEYGRYYMGVKWRAEGWMARRRRNRGR